MQPSVADRPRGTGAPWGAPSIPQQVAPAYSRHTDRYEGRPVKRWTTVRYESGTSIRLPERLYTPVQMVYSIPRQEVAAMSPDAKRATVGLLGGAGLVFLLVGATSSVYAVTTGLIIMFVCWLLAGVLRSYWGMGKNNVRAKKAGRIKFNRPIP